MPPEPTAVEAAPATPVETPPATPRRAPGPALTAAAVWAVGLPLAFWLPSRLDVDPFVQRSADLPLAVLLGGTLLLTVVGLRHRGGRLIGAAAGAHAAYTALVVRCALSGTPFGYSGFSAAGDRVSVMGDAGRIAAMATRYTVNWKSSDGIVGTVPSEYPPLYPYLIGKTAWLLDVPAWRLLGAAQAVTLSLGLLLAFVLWARIVPAGAALLIGPLVLAACAEPAKAYEFFTLAVLVPLVLNTVARPERGRLHWAWAGLGYGLVVLVYYGYVVFLAIGVAAIGRRAWRSEPDRRGLLLYLAKTTAVTAVLSSWFVVPYLWAMLRGGQQVGDMYSSAEASGNPLTFLQFAGLGPVQFLGLLALLWYARTRWWAWSLLAMVGGAYAYLALSMVRWVLTAHNGLFYYVRLPVAACLIAGAVLGVREAVPALAERRGRLLAPWAGVLAAGLAAVFAGYGFWTANMPVNRWEDHLGYGSVPDYTRTKRFNWEAARAHAMFLPDGSRPEHAAATDPLLPVMRREGRLRALPVDAIRRMVEQVRPRDRTPSTLSYDEQVFVFLPWNGYLGVDRVAAYGPTRWPDRFAELRKLAGTGPSGFAAASARTRFGSIDVFVLEKDGAGVVWRGIQAPAPSDVRFDYAQFKDFVTRDVGNGTFVAVRRP
ncbi:hypothetical protein DZF91_25830 [Actinomadura logoneensis]|uniref:Arabinofuranosyltransferase AftA N-terminal domain-containing protein n=1 Tax=Actinomadura logoneensis TaxID=2293572 RepID=A0A372JFK6_9ACTN|nr:arabinofuranosyltransferase [Actinomadura logoneensis]RFU38791.1 hypothetical protein DZF91_25830 [Actinomadura logoneensis]